MNQREVFQKPRDEGLGSVWRGQWDGRKELMGAAGMAHTPGDNGNSYQHRSCCSLSLHVWNTRQPTAGVFVGEDPELAEIRFLCSGKIDPWASVLICATQDCIVSWVDSLSLSLCLSYPFFFISSWSKSLWAATKAIRDESSMWGKTENPIKCLVLNLTILFATRMEEVEMP